MDLGRLRHKGWSEAEIEHVRAVTGGDATGVDHLLLWTLVALLAIGGLGIAMLLLPVLLFANLLSIPLGLMLGLCLGLLLTHALRSLRMQRQHHMRAFLFLTCVSFIATAIGVHLLEQRFRLLAGTPHSALIITIPLVIGMIIPYTTERRLHEYRESQGPKAGGSHGTA